MSQSNFRDIWGVPPSQFSGGLEVDEGGEGGWDKIASDKKCERRVNKIKKQDNNSLEEKSVEHATVVQS